MVTGGYDRSTRLDSTEIFSESVWRTVAGKLPDPMRFLRVATINNRVLSFGRDILRISSSNFLDYYPETISKSFRTNIPLPADSLTNGVCC